MNSSVFLASDSLPFSSAQPASFDPSALLAFLPFILFLIVIYWGNQKHGRKKKVLEISYNLIALQLLSYLLLPVCSLPLSCFVWALIPIAMFTLVAGYGYRCMYHEAQHHLRVAKAMSEGHVKPSGLLESKIENDLKAKVKTSPPNDEVPEAPKKPASKPPEKSEEHKDIEKLVESVVKKKSPVAKKKKPAKKP
jgi:hypothetical protein